MSPFRFQYGCQLKEQVRPANQDIRQYYDPDLPIYGPWKLWQTKPELPSPEEILGTDVPGDVVALAPNCISGSWVSKEKYLEAHYSLIREDSVAPLRNAVGRVRADPFMRDTPDISIYEKVPDPHSSTSKVFVIGVTLTRSGFALHIQFSTRRAVVALTPKQNAFSSKCVVAIVACRLQEGVEKDPPEIDIFLASPDDIEIDPQQEWIMVEARAGYFEANRHTLTALQKLSKESFPLNEQICSLAGDIDAPEYVNAAPCMDFTPLSELSALNITGRYDVLERWPSQPMGKLDPSQWSALDRMLTKKLAIIQGPPGTGKTFTSIAALKIMLSNKEPNDSPIIIAAQTNHALDQLIKHISVFEKNYVRLGGRTTDPEIRKRTPYEIRQTQGLLKIEGGLMTPMIKKQNKLAGQIDKLLEPFAPSNSSKPLPASLFQEHGILSQEQVDALDHPSVENHPLVPGMGAKRSFFFDHTSQESADSLLSKVNDFEASMVVSLLAYLVMNKVPATSITVLTFYNGQRKLIMRKKAQNINIAQSYVNILTVDSYQGEENDIVILSLVRSNYHRGIGFLEQDNRVCVALSRAKYGLYIFGNAQCVSKHSNFWNAVINVMSEDQQAPRMAPALPLYCARHNQETFIKTSLVGRICHADTRVPINAMVLNMTGCLANSAAVRSASAATGHAFERKTQVFDAGADWNDVGEDDDRNAMIGPIIRPLAPTRAFAFIDDEKKSPFADGVRIWQAFAQGGAIVDDHRRAKLHIRGNRPQEDDTSVNKNATTPVEGNLISFDEYRLAKLSRGRQPQEDDIPVEKNVTSPVKEDLIQFGDNCRPELPFRGKHPRTDTTLVEENTADPVEGDLINFDDDDDPEAEVLGKGEDQHTAPAKKVMAIYDGAGDGEAEAMSEVKTSFPPPSARI
ncbi:hypothetical protein N7463_001795 [Penicillium fimorum]|uniref:Uncharacterized protein n=1 Tax=Penicillium fimorum TaxID=1882269 RepID=A0A9W9XXW2_9EURO|nr:hypothetical protein N7463_001795 [Penicillium fimorum]